MFLFKYYKYLCFIFTLTIIGLFKYMAIHSNKIILYYTFHLFFFLSSILSH